MPGVRIKRKKRPPQRRLLYLAWIVGNLAGVVVNLTRALGGDDLDFFFAGSYLAWYFGWRWFMRREERLNGLSRPVRPIEWLMVAWLWAIVLSIALL